MSATWVKSAKRKDNLSPRRLDKAFDQEVGSSTGKMILCVICRFGNETGKCFASIPKIAAQANCKEVTVRKWLKEFLVRGWLVELPSNGRCTRTFAVKLGSPNSNTPDPSKTVATPVKNDPQNPKNQNMKSSCSSLPAPQLGRSIPADLSPWEMIPFLREQSDRENGGGSR